MTTLWIGTRKGAFRLDSTDRKTWKLSGPQFLGNLVYHVMRNAKNTLLMATSAGHLGPALHRSTDDGATWVEVANPPKFPADEPRKRAVNHVFWLTAAANVWYAGTSPQALFVSHDDGLSWQGVAGFNDHPEQKDWAGGDQDQTPEGGKLHSIQVDPRDPRKLLLGMSGGGVFFTEDAGATWQPLHDGVEAEYGQDPHCVAIHPTDPDRLWMQSHYGIYRMDRKTSNVWQRVGKNMPADVGDIGFPIVIDPRDPDCAWVFPMDGTSVWPRTSPGGKPAVFGTRDAGATWQRLDRGLPREQAWWTVKRQGMCGDAHDPMGLYFGTTSGEIWASANRGEDFACIARHLPHVYSVTAW
ncbi:MAG: glycosyl hydrolase [Myxococcales bacterium]|nr:glycosyl hydrolase [Myxococcales bacterium]